jgi:DNA-damage-inducible protein J
MPETRLSVRVDEDVKKRAEYVFHELGLSMTTGIVLYLKQVVSQQGIPFFLTQNHQGNNEMGIRKEIEELKSQMAINSKTIAMKERGMPVALYDEQKKRPYLEYPDGQRGGGDTNVERNAP